MLWLHDSSSLDTSSRISGLRNRNAVNTTFGFDREIFNSKVYFNAAILSLQPSSHGMQSSAVSSQLSTVSSRIKTSNIVSRYNSRHQKNDGPAPAKPILTAEIPDLATQVEHNTDSREVQTIARQNKRSRDSIISILSRNTSIFKFGQRRALSSSLRQISLEPCQAPRNAIKVLLLGSASSGKTTVIKSLEASFGHYTRPVRESYRWQIFDNVIQSMEMLIKHREDISVLIDCTEDEVFQQDKTNFTENIASSKSLGTSHFPQELASVISRLWHDSAIRSTFSERRNKRFHLLESAE